MANTAKTTGFLLIALGVIFYLATMSSWTALIPAVFGLAILICGFVGARRPSWNKHAMHAAVLLAILAIIGSMRAFSALFAGEGLSAAVAEQLLTILICVVFVVMAVRSFITARRATP